MARCDPSPPFIFSLKASNFLVLLGSRSPKATKSIEILIFFIRLASLTRLGSSSAIGEHVNTMIRCRCDLFCRCFNANLRSCQPALSCTHIVLTPAICIPVAKWVVPEIFVRCIPSRILPKSVVRVTNTSGLLPPMLMSPTEDSGFDWVLALKMRLTASACASQREGLSWPL